MNDPTFDPSLLRPPPDDGAAPAFLADLRAVVKKIEADDLRTVTAAAIDDLAAKVKATARARLPAPAGIVYIAGPYAAETDAGVKWNVARAVALGALFAKKGFFPVIPHVTVADAVGLLAGVDADGLARAICYGRGDESTANLDTLAENDAIAVILRDDGTMSTGTAAERRVWAEHGASTGRWARADLAPAGTWAQWCDAARRYDLDLEALAEAYYARRWPDAPTKAAPKAPAAPTPAPKTPAAPTPAPKTPAAPWRAPTDPPPIDTFVAVRVRCDHRRCPVEIATAERRRVGPFDDRWYVPDGYSIDDADVLGWRHLTLDEVAPEGA